MCENSPLFKQLSEGLKNPFDILEKLEQIKVFGNPKSPYFSKPNSLPNIIVLDEASTGSRVISGLIGFSLPSGFDFPILFKFQTGNGPKILFQFEFKGGVVPAKEVIEDDFKTQIETCMQEIPENLRSPVEVTFTVIHSQPFDFTLVFLPQIHKHSDSDQDTMEIHRFQGYVERYTRGVDGVFLNVLECSSDGFGASLSRRLLYQLDYTGKRALTVFTNLGSSSSDLISEIISTQIVPGNPVGYFFVDVEDAKNEIKKDEKKLSKVPKEAIGFNAISKNLVVAMLSILFHPRSRVLLKIEHDLQKSKAELESYQVKFASISQAVPTISVVFELALRDLIGLFETKEYGRYKDESDMHVALDIVTRLQMFKRSMKELQVDTRQPFLLYELELLRDKVVPRPTNFVSSSITKSLIEAQFSYATSVIEASVSRMVCYIERVMVRLLMDNSKEHVQIHQYLKTLANFWVKELEKKFREKLNKLIDLETRIIFTCKSDFDLKVNEIDLKLVFDEKNVITDAKLGEQHIKVDHLGMFPRKELEKALELKKIMLVYWELVIERMGDYYGMYLKDSLAEMTSKYAIIEFNTNHIMKALEEKRVLPTGPNVSFNENNTNNRVCYLNKALEEIRKLQFEFPV